MKKIDDTAQTIERGGGMKAVLQANIKANGQPVMLVLRGSPT